MKPRPALGSCSASSGRRERTDRNVISVRISERELRSLSVRIHVWLLFEPLHCERMTRKGKLPTVLELECAG
jgi:hypothetical protein